jgi:RecA-family ATPase
LKIVRLPGLTDYGDVSDFLVTHSFVELTAEIKKCPQWHPPEAAAPQFVAQAPEKIDWLVEGIIERDSNGFFVAAPKGGKSWAAIYLALSLALGCDWLGFQIPIASRVALITREDNPSLTAWRIKHLFAGKSCAAPGLIETNLYVNSRRESAELMLDNPEQMAELLAALKLIRLRFAIFDGFNVWHAADENDNQEMRTVLRQLSTIQAEIGCGIGVVHHYNKTDQGSMTQRMRGSSAIAGWAEWLIGISMVDEETKTRRMEFELKADQPPDPIFYRIESSGESAKLARVAYQHHEKREGSAAARLMQ